MFNTKGRGCSQLFSGLRSFLDEQYFGSRDSDSAVDFGKALGLQLRVLSNVCADRAVQLALLVELNGMCSVVLWLEARSCDSFVSLSVLDRVVVVNIAQASRFICRLAAGMFLAASCVAPVNHDLHHCRDTGP